MEKGWKFIDLFGSTDFAQICGEGCPGRMTQTTQIKMISMKNQFEI
jgi:hypothetical protein